MPLEDQFHPPWQERNPWEGFHSAWINTIVRHLNGQLLPRRYRAMPQVHPEYEVRIHDDERGRCLVAVIELISPGNKDRPESRPAFVTKSAAYLQEQVNLLIVDIVTSRRTNIHRELLRQFDKDKPSSADGDLYCVSYHNRKEQNRWHLDFWPYALAVGSPLPTVPLWLAADFSVALDLENTYTETREVLRIE